jgi:hypothetical protein
LHGLLPAPPTSNSGPSCTPGHEDRQLNLPARE